MSSCVATILPAAEWQGRAAAHRARAREWTEPFRRRRARRESHPIFDFLFVYYRYSPGKLEQWHPGLGVALETAGAEFGSFGKHYRRNGGVLTLDGSTMDTLTRSHLQFILRLNRSVETRPARFGCFGLHEWAMVYRRNEDGEVRHGEKLPLRLPPAEIDMIVERGPVACGHYDAFRFFTPSARRFNRLRPTKESRVASEQCGCLHTNMDLYRWAAESMPWVGTAFLWSCFELAVKARELDMQASPYDCRPLGYDPIPIETDVGRAEYERRQRRISESAGPLRRALIERLETVLERSQAAPAEPAGQDPTASVSR